MTLNHAVALAFMLALIAVGVCIGYLVWGRQVIAVEERAAAPVWHDDGTLTAGRYPGAEADLPETSAPPGGKLIRTVEVTVRAKPAIINAKIKGDKSSVTVHNGAYKDSTPSLNQPISAAECPPVTVRLDMREYRDGPDLGLRVSVVSDGEVLDAVDIPRDTIYMPRNTRNVIGADRIGDTTTVRYQRSVGRLDIGPAVTLLDDNRAALGLSLAWRW